MIIENFNPLTDPMIQALDEKGNIVRKELVPVLSAGKLKEIFATMVFLRTADQKLISLQRQGRCGTYPSVEGQEACQAGSVLMLEKTDWIFPAFRELAACFLHGLSLEKIFAYWMGNEWGSHTDACVAPVSIPVGTHLLHAAGYAWGAKLQNKKTVAVAYFGDGATSTGDFYEALNFAGLYCLPVIFFCQNNHWAISTPRHKQTATKTLAQKAIAAEIRGVQVDGNDIFAVAAVMKDAVDAARSGAGATLIEAYTYRLGHHTTSDDSTKYRHQKEVDEWKPKDPILRLKLYLQKNNLWDESFQALVEKEAEEKVAQAVKAAENMPKPAPNEMFDFLYEKPTSVLEEGKSYLKNFFH